MSVGQRNSFQIRLLLDPEWVAQLDSLATSRHLSRLALIRFYLRDKIDEEYAQLAEHYRRQDEHRRAHKRLQNHLDDMEW